MIIDTFSNIDFYKRLSPDIYAGLAFLAGAKSDLEFGVHTISGKVRAIVEEYETSVGSSMLFESHKRMIDIQYPVVGVERVLWSPISEMIIDIPYDEAQDRTYFSALHDQANHVDIGNGVFAIFFETDGHAPKHCANTPELIKKVTIKIAVTDYR